MDTMKLCPGCHKPLAPNAPDGLCPACLMKAGLGTGADIGPDSQGESARIPFAAPTSEAVARWFPQLEILGFIGQGGMGAVYKARQKALGVAPGNAPASQPTQNPHRIRIGDIDTQASQIPRVEHAPTNNPFAQPASGAENPQS